GTQREWCEAGVLRAIRRRSLAKLRHEAEPVEQQALARLFTTWQQTARKRRGLDALLEVIESLQGYPMAASIFESEILAARIDDYRPSDLDTLSAAGEIVWTGIEPLGERDGRIALYLTDHLPLLHEPATPPESPLVDYLRSHGASFFDELQAAAGGFPNETVDALWDLVWRGVVTNDTFHALRAYTRRAPAAKRTTTPRGAFRSRRIVPPGTQGRWSLIRASSATATQRANAITHQLLHRYGLLTREAPGAENVPGGFSAVYPVLKAMEEAGRLRRGYFVSGLGATQFAMAGAVEILRANQDEEAEPQSVLLAATDPANPYGAILKWPGEGLSRSVGASVILVDGAMACWIGRGEKQLATFLPEEEPSRTRVARAVARALAALVESGSRRALLITEVNGERAPKSAIAPFLAEAGFIATSLGYQKRTTMPSAVAASRTTPR